MLRVIFDTNIYGHLLSEPDAAKIEENIRTEKDFIVYGYAPIRKEIRDIPKVTKLSQRNRMLMLQLYDKITDNHLLADETAVNHVAKKYYDYYKRLGGTYGWDTSIRIDFMLVACASKHGLDIVYSNDNKTLSSKKAQKAYLHINLKENMRTPNFLSYNDLITKFRTQ